MTAESTQPSVAGAGCRGHLTPARRALASAIEDTARAQAELAAVFGAMQGLRQRAAAAAQLDSAVAFRDSLMVLRNSHDLTLVVAASEMTPRSGELTEAEKLFTRIADAAEAARAQHAAAEGTYAPAVERVRGAARERDRAACVAALEAAEPAIAELRAHVGAVTTAEARLRSLVLALRATGKRDPSVAQAAMTAAWQLERAIACARPAGSSKWESAYGLNLLERLRSDAMATL